MFVSLFIETKSEKAHCSEHKQIKLNDPNNVNRVRLKPLECSVLFETIIVQRIIFNLSFLIFKCVVVF
jgi:hypothetical protein